ncbi:MULTISPECIES: hypothetical protein [unclassified Caulobacter]|uniref:hypothetical protein n=1 Tax=unclassified Caulobacter TaxID=2648921 RepID=UPI0007143A52|nr:MULTISPECIES: hypothetical protein [unclassified Caulobacter]KQV56521.1 hypothetical protein ASC62_09310 [Caulobacter sp. Root342]
MAALAAASVLSGCAKPDSVLFVTNASFGVNVEGKPASASVGYDRTEGYLAPSFPSGAAPPVIASIETGGGLLNPKVRQLYATGAAAVKASGSHKAPDGPTTLEGAPAAKRMIFFGTTTSLGMKVAVDASGTPDAFTFGYKRKEYSYIPLTKKDAKTETYVYPSVLASIDTVTLAAAPATKGSGLTSRQFFATGPAAEALAADTSAIFREITESALSAALTPEQKQKAIKTATETVEAQRNNTTAIMNAVAPGGALDTEKLKALLDAANAKGADLSSTYAAQTTAEGLRGLLHEDPHAAMLLAGALPSSQTNQD